MSIQENARRKLTYEDYTLIPEDLLRHEVLDGEHYVTPAPTPRHQGVLGALHLLLGSFVRERGLGHLFFSPIDVVLSEHDIAQPDLVFISNERAGLIGQKYIQGAPDLVVEVLSESTRRTDETVKRTRYERGGVGEYWIIDPRQRTVRVFRRTGSALISGSPLAASAGHLLASPLFPGLNLRVSDLFA